MLGKKISRKLLAASLAIGAFTFTPQINDFNFVSTAHAARENHFKPTLTARDILQKATNLYRQGQYQEALQYLNRAIEMNESQYDSST